MAQKITFTVAPEIVKNATSGILLGDFNNWNFEQGIALKKEKDGSLKATTALESGTYQYRYFLSDGRWVNDSNAGNYMYSEGFFVHNCVITVAEEVVIKTQKAKKQIAVREVIAAPIAVETTPTKVKKVAKKEVVAEVATEPIKPVKKAVKAKK